MRWIDAHAKRIAVGLMVLIAAVSVVTLIRGERTRIEVAHISASFAAPCSKNARGQACIKAQVKGAQQIPQRVICIIVRRAGYPCRTATLAVYELAAHHRHHHRRHHRHHHRRHCVINIVGIRVCSPKKVVTADV